MTYVLSDIHGNLKNFRSILKQIHLGPDDALYVLGDVIDRHPYGVELLLQIMDIPNAHMLLGNHEYMMMRALGFPYDGEDDLDDGLTGQQKLSHWYSNGGNVTHLAWIDTERNIQERMIAYLKHLPLNFRVAVGGREFLLCHACPTLLFDSLSEGGVVEALPGMATYFSVWERRCIRLMDQVDTFTTIYGHTPTSSLQTENPLKIFYGEHTIDIDCGSGFPRHRFLSGKRGRLACLRLEDMKEFYSET